MTARRTAFTRDRAAGLALLLLAAAIAWQARVLPVGTLWNPGAGYMPLATAAALGALGAVLAVKGGGPPLRDMAWPEAWHAGLLLGACALAAFALERLGYRLTMIALLAFLLGAVERKRPFAVAAVALGLSLGSFYLFSDLLRVPLPRGPGGF